MPHRKPGSWQASLTARQARQMQSKTRRTDQCHRQANRKVYHIGNEKRPHDSESAKNSVGCHFDAHKDKEATKPSHIIPRHLISQGGSVFSKEQRGNLRVQRFNDKEGKNSKACIQHQCCAVAFFDTLGFVCAKVLGNIRRNRIADGHKIREKTFSTRIVAAYPASACVPKGFTTACTIIIPMDTVDC